ncbi:MAG TPA: hypothetical protein H9869_05945 [Candidatus Ligilactobacillus excrementipullorum]|nr:hypothetical protein [Candidatus Ligilactobacillus excrementipullorum]
MKKLSRRTKHQLVTETEINLTKFLASPLGQPFKTTMDLDSVRYVIMSFTAAAYTTSGQKPAEWTEQTVSHVIGSYFPRFLDDSDELVGQITPLLSNYLSFLERELHYIDNSVPLIKAVCDANVDLVMKTVDQPSHAFVKPKLKVGQPQMKLRKKGKQHKK